MAAAIHILPLAALWYRRFISCCSRPFAIADSRLAARDPLLAAIRILLLSAHPHEAAVTTARGDLHPAGAKPSRSAVSEATVFNNSPSVALGTIVLRDENKYQIGSTPEDAP